MNDQYHFEVEQCSLPDRWYTYGHYGSFRDYLLFGFADAFPASCSWFVYITRWIR